MDREGRKQIRTPGSRRSMKSDTMVYSGRFDRESWTALDPQQKGP